MSADEPGAVDLKVLVSLLNATVETIRELPVDERKGVL